MLSAVSILMVNIHILYISENKQRLVLLIAETYWYLWPRWNVFTAWYGLGI